MFSFQAQCVFFPCGLSSGKWHTDFGLPCLGNIDTDHNLLISSASHKKSHYIDLVWGSEA